MKYIELNINKKLLGEDYLIYDWKETEEEIHIYAKSQSHTGTCPKCGQSSSSYHATYSRTVQTVPINMKRTYIHIIVYKYDCFNDTCSQKVFMEEPYFVLASQVRTIELTELILAVSIFLSNEGASKVLGLIGVKVSNDTIKRIYDRLLIEDEPDIEEVGIDDVSIRKGRTYATAIYDLNDHHLVALLDGRDADTLKEWLMHHKKIKLVARDRASAYAKAINEILPECIQVADRFHLLQNLIERMREIFKDELPSDIFIKDGNILDDVPEKEKVLKILPDSKELEQYHYDNEAPISGNGELITYDNKKHDLDSKQYQKQAESRRKKQQLIQTVQKRWKELDEKDVATIVKEFSISCETAKKYIHMTEEKIASMDHPANYKKRKTVVDDYLNIIYKMLYDNVEPATILAYTIRCGYSGNLNTMQKYIELLAKNNFERTFPMNWAYKCEYPKDIIKIKRNEILKYITTKNPEIKQDENVGKYLDIIKEKYKIVAELEKAYNDFHKTLMGNDPIQLGNFIEEYEVSAIKGFIDGIKKDIDPVKNAISYDVSSGFVEGNNNKFKLIKRILYGRASLGNLFKKCYVAFQSKLDNFNLSNLIPALR